MMCLACSRELHEECETAWDTEGEQCCCRTKTKSDETKQASFGSLGSTEQTAIVVRGRPRKDDDKITTSAGRKRAGVEYDIDLEEYCEWRGFANVGGGKHPIVGCLTGMQKHRHHGPIKNTARNEEGNVHRICAKCHNRWHAANDNDYDEVENEKLPHNPQSMTIQDMLMSGKS